MAGFDGKVALVTGGNSGIGRATALAFARQGARVVIAARRTEPGEEVAHAIHQAGGEAVFVRADVARAEDVEALVRRTVEVYGPLDCALNNAAIEGEPRTLADYSEEEYDELMGVDLKGVWLCMKHQIRQMLAQSPSGGTIVNTSSVNGLGGVAHGSLYAAAKAGVLALTKSAAQELGGQGIRVNALVAGGFRTPMLQRVFARHGGPDPEAQAAVEGQLSQLIPLGRIGNPEEAADAVLWLCSDASSYMTGNSLILDGGLTAYYR
ncbi:MAG TPA: glucose 1-dehydrogenase [Thermoanaerobaculia bacterium]|nr:glucose 1-dehydrogenase [Thermoanaerobaculia bacterium]